MALILILVIGGAWALARLFEISTAGGAIFPAYSSLRADPLGTKALHDALARLDGYRVERSFQPWPAFRGNNAAVLILGESAHTWRMPDEVTLADYETRAAAGTRLIVALQGESGLPPLTPNLKERNLLADRWKLRIEAAKNGKGTVFARLDGSWKVLVENGGETAAVERQFGSGEVVLLNDSFPFSNEALQLHRDTALLLRVLATGATSYLRSHLGTVLTGLVGQLLRRYRLETAALTLVLLAILFLWRSSSSLVPAREDDSSTSIQGRGEEEALTSLLHRGITPGNAAGVILGIWRKSAALMPMVSGDRRARIERELEQAAGKDLLACGIARTNSLAGEDDRTTRTPSQHS